MNLSEKAREAARRCEEIASYHSGTDLAERLRAVDGVIEQQKEQLLVAAAMIDELTLEVAGERGRRERAEAENASLEKKVERLSLRIIGLWGKEAEDGRDETGN